MVPENVLSLPRDSHCWQHGSKTFVQRLSQTIPGAPPPGLFHRWSAVATWRYHVSGGSRYVSIRLSLRRLQQGIHPVPSHGGGRKGRRILSALRRHAGPSTRRCLYRRHLEKELARFSVFPLFSRCLIGRRLTFRAPRLRWLTFRKNSDGRLYFDLLLNKILLGLPSKKLLKIRRKRLLHFIFWPYEPRDACHCAPLRQSLTIPRASGSPSPACSLVGDGKKPLMSLVEKGKEMIVGAAKQDWGKIRVDINECKGCGLCIEACPPRVIALGQGLNHYGYRTAAYAGSGCTGCGICFLACPEPGALTVLRLANRTSDRSPRPENTGIGGKEAECPDN